VENSTLLPLEKRISDKIRAAFVHWKLLMNSPSPLSEMLMVHCTNIWLKQKTKRGRTLLQPWNYATLAPIAIKKTWYKKVNTEDVAVTVISSILITTVATTIIMGLGPHPP